MNALEQAERELARGEPVPQVAARLGLRRDQVEGVAAVMRQRAARAAGSNGSAVQRPAKPAPSGDVVEAAFERITTGIDELLDNRNLTQIHKLLATAREQLGKARQRMVDERDKAALQAERKDLEARLADVKRRLAGPASPSGGGPAASVVRAWAAEHGVDCPAKGRIPHQVLDAWRQAGGPS